MKKLHLYYPSGKFSIMSDLYILLGGGADVNPADISGLTPLHLAARLGNESLVRILLDRGADPSLKDMYNFTSYDHAKENSHFSIMKRLNDHTEAICNVTPNCVVEKADAPPSESGAAVHYSNFQGENDKSGDVTHRIKNEVYKSRSHRTSVAW